jgi:prevent-host-death family protein
MPISSTEAKNRFGQMLDEAQKRPVVIEKSGRRHSVVLSAEHYDRLVARAANSIEPVAEETLNPQGTGLLRQVQGLGGRAERTFRAFRHLERGIQDLVSRRWRNGTSS